MKRKWKIENNKEEVQFQTLQKAPTQRAYEERKNLPWTNNRKRHSTGCSSISLNKQRFVVFMVNFPPSRIVIVSRLLTDYQHCSVLSHEDADQIRSSKAYMELELQKSQIL